MNTHPWFGEKPFDVGQSARFDSGKSQFLSRTFGTNSSDRIKTFSCWFKLGKLGTQRCLASTTVAGNIESRLEIGSNNHIKYAERNAANGTSNALLISDHFLRDIGAWYHIVLAIDTTDGTEGNRIKIYLNGVRVTDFSTETYMGQNYDLMFYRSSVINFVGKDSGDAGYMDGYLAEVHFVDGLALTPDYFGETGDFENWIPKFVNNPALTYGNNGFYLPFKQDFTVEGFNTVLYQGNATKRIISGVGFQPDWVFVRNRNTDTNGLVFDTLRDGGSASLRPDSNAMENNATDELEAFTSDGFLLATGGDVNGDGKKLVAWCWDMSPDGTTGQHITAVGNANVSTDQEKFGNTSLHLDGTGDCATFRDSKDFDFGTADFTVECFIYHAAAQDAYDGIITFNSGNQSSFGFGLGYNANAKLSWLSSLGNVTNVVTASTVPANDAWHHIAVVRASGVTTLYVNGTAADSAADTYCYAAGEYDGDGIAGAIGRYYPSVDEKYFLGYIDEVRISRIARYTANFTPTSSAFTTDNRTSALYHFEGANNATSGTGFYDNSVVTRLTTGDIDADVMANTTYGQSVVRYTGQADAGTIPHGLGTIPEVVITKKLSGGSAYGWGIYHQNSTSDDNVGSQMRTLDFATTGAKANTDIFNYGQPTNAVFTVGQNNFSNVDGSEYIAYCFDSVAGYSKFSAYTGNGNATGPSVTLGFRPAWILIKSTSAAENWNLFDNTRTASNTGEDARLKVNVTSVEDSAVFIDFNDNGFQIKTTDGEVNTNTHNYVYLAFADTREYAFFLDQSGKGNHWNNDGLDDSSIVLDNPSNNFCVLNFLGAAANELSHVSAGQNLVTGTDASDGGAYTKGTMIVPKNQKVYFEVFGIDDKIYAGALLASSEEFATGSRPDGGYLPGLIAYYTDTDTNAVRYRATTAGTALGTENITGANYFNAVIGITIDQAQNLVGFYPGGLLKSELGQSNAVDTTSDYVPLIAGYQSNVMAVNFGQDSSFGGRKESQGYTDANGEGDFFYKPPAGHIALCSNNLDGPNVIPNEAFAATLYTGNGAATGNITDDIKNFGPDFVWIKQRSEASDHILGTKVDGDGKYLQSHEADTVLSDAERFRAFLSNGAQIGTSDEVSQASQTYVMWTWKAGSGDTAFAESGNNPGGTHNANKGSGFSLVSYTGTGANGTVSHGLDRVPDAIIVKNRDVADNWAIYLNLPQASINATDYFILNTSAAVADDAAWWNDTTPTSSVFTVGTDHSVNADGEKYVAFCFANTEGFCRVGSYYGNGSADGPYVNLGFTPSLIIYKKTTSENWHMLDDVRSVLNPNTIGLDPNLNSVEADDANIALDFLSNGFKVRSSHATANADGVHYLYIAFAAKGMKHTNAK